MKIGLLSDAHGNVDAFNRGLEILTRQDVSQIYFLGDAVGYIPDINVVRRLQKGDIISIKGNHEQMLLQGGCNEQKEAIYQLELSRSKLNNTDIAFLNNRSESLNVEINGQSILMVHGSPNEPVTGYVYPDTPLDPFNGVTDDIVFMGNTHRPFIRKYGTKKFVNIGSCGLPRDDIYSACVCTYDAQSNCVEMIRYDISDIIDNLIKKEEISKELKKYLVEKISRSKKSGKQYE